MSAPHPAAVGSYGPEFAADVATRGGRLRWWQLLVATRMLEHDAEGALVWWVTLLTMARQCGKSWLLREVCSWRIRQRERFGEPQLVLHTGKDLSVVREVQRPARAWARAMAETDDRWQVYESNGREEIIAPGDGRWLLRAREAVYGYSASAAVVDEAWKVSAEAVEDGIEPTMVERASAQLLLVSTAHRRATSLMVARRLDAIAALREPRETLLIEWSARPDLNLDDRDGWRAASPSWSHRREVLIEAKLARAMAGNTDDPDEDDPVASFRAQWLNIWPEQAGNRRGRAEPLIAETAWAALADLSLAPPAGPLVLCVEDHFGMGAAAAAVGRIDGDRVAVWGVITDRRPDAYAWVAMLALAHPASRLLLGASLDGDPAAAVVPVDPVTMHGGALRAALPMLREWVGASRLVHDGGDAMARQVTNARVVPSPAGGLLLAHDGGRADLLRAVAWALRETVVVAVEPTFEPFRIL